MGALLEDQRYSIRQLVKSPGLTLTALVSLVLGIGATTAVFSVIYAALINPYPFVGADRIVRLTIQSKAGQGDWANLDGPQIQRVRQLGMVESLLAMDYHAMTVTGHELPENVNAIGLISNGFTDVYLPLKLTQDPGLLYIINLRLRKGVTHEQADAALDLCWTNSPEKCRTAFPSTSECGWRD